MKPLLILSCALLSLPALAQEIGDRPDASPATSDNGWRYGTEGTGDAARIYATVTGETEDGARVELTFSHSDLSGRQARLTELPASLDCPAVCEVGLSIDGVADTVRATIPPSADATLSLRNAREIWTALDEAERLEVTFPETGGGQGTAIFDVRAIDLTALPGW